MKSLLACPTRARSGQGDLLFLKILRGHGVVVELHDAAIRVKALERIPVVGVYVPIS